MEEYQEDNLEDNSSEEEDNLIFEVVKLPKWTEEDMKKAKMRAKKIRKNIKWE